MSTLDARPANRLGSETSPYLRQHAHNPVDWYPWGEEALSRARTEDRPILLSVGYSACHWCHVMERESFENVATATVMNDLFVNVKVDREERPDLDQIYQLVVQLMGRGGGWPLTVFLTPDLRPFFGGTYFPPAPRYGMPSFSEVLRGVADAYSRRRDDVEKSARALTDGIREATRPMGGEVDPPRDLLERTASKLAERFDDRNGGFGDAPKFPNAMALEVLLRAWKQHGDAEALARVERALEAMRANGLWDQLGGGFHRYSTDAGWRVPHFEKMLYDNALLVRLYTDAWRATRKPRWEQTVRAALGYLVREMRAPGGAFFSTQDADSEGEEGKFFVWTPEQVRDVLGEADGQLACRLWGVVPGGNFEHGATVLYETRTVAALAAEVGVDEGQVAARIESARARLLEARERRPKPFRDEKILTTWNGLAIGAFARAAGAFDDDALADVARAALAFVRAELWRDGSLLRVHTSGESRVDAFLEDWADLAGAALDVFEMCGDADALGFARELADGAIERFWDADHGGFFFARAGAPDLIVRAKAPYDNATPSGTSSMSHALLRLHALTDDDRYDKYAERTLRTLAGPALEGPLGFGNLVGALDRLVRGPTEIVVVGEAADAATRALLAVARRAYDGNAVVVPVAAGAGAPGLASRHTSMPMRDGVATAYVCRNRACSAPVTTADELEGLLR